MKCVPILRDEKGLVFGFGAIQRFLKCHAVTHKMTAHAAEQNRPDILRQREVNRPGSVEDYNVQVGGSPDEQNDEQARVSILRGRVRKRDADFETPYETSEEA